MAFDLIQNGRFVTLYGLAIVKEAMHIHTSAVWWLFGCWTILDGSFTTGFAANFAYYATELQPFSTVFDISEGKSALRGFP